MLDLIDLICVFYWVVICSYFYINFSSFSFLSIYFFSDILKIYNASSGDAVFNRELYPLIFEIIDFRICAYIFKHFG